MAFDDMSMSERFRWAILLIGLLLALKAEVQGQEVTLTSMAREVYMAPDGAVFYAKPVIQSDLKVAWKSGVYVDLWSSVSLSRQIDDGKEIDLTVGWAIERKHFRFITDATYFAFVGDDGLNATAEVGLGPFFGRGEVWRYPRESGGEGGFFSSAGVKKEFIARRLSLTLEAYYKYDSGVYGLDATWLEQGRVGLAFAVTDKLRLLGGVTLSRPMTILSATDHRTDQAVWEIGVVRAWGKK